MLPGLDGVVEQVLVIVRTPRVYGRGSPPSIATIRLELWNCRVWAYAASSLN